MVRLSSSMDLTPVASLRSEIIESQKSGADFLKWKLIATATVASILAGVGQKEAAPEELHLLIFLIPLICAYVDLVSLDLAVRILTIGAYLRTHGDVYEQWVERVRTTEGKNPFAFAPIAVHGSSLAISLTILLVGWYGRGHAWNPDRVRAYVLAGIGGAIIAVLLWHFYRSRAKFLRTLTPHE